MLALLAFTLVQNSATMPVSRMGEQWWAERHARCVEATKRGGFDVAFLGDSITQGWEGAGAKVWNADFGAMRPANFGFSGDRIEHVLWRLDNGEVIGAKPKVVVIMIGTNNIGSSQSAEDTAEGVTAIVKKLLAKTDAKILLLGIFPRSEMPNDRNRVGVDRATSIFWRACDLPRVTRVDIGRHFMHSDGTLRTLLMPDLLHLNPAGYSIWSAAILPTLKKLSR